LVLPEAYPFDPFFGSRLKYQLQTRDLNLRQTLITTEINNIVKVIQAQVQANVVVENIQIVPTGVGGGTEYDVTILLKINDDQRKKVSVNFIGPS